MGLDMYLEGHVHFWHNWDDPDKDLKRDGFRVGNMTLELGYWRKHPDLHGYIVQEFAGGKDECQDIPLTADNMIEIVAAIKAKALPHTEGFFFGSSINDAEEEKESIETFLRAINWLEGVPVHRTIKREVALGAGMVAHEIDMEAAKAIKESRVVIYRASW